VERLRRIAAWQLARPKIGMTRRRELDTARELRWWREQALADEFSYGDARGPQCPGAGLDPDLDWI
jgi:hypothetical protein